MEHMSVKLKEFKNQKVKFLSYGMIALSVMAAYQDIKTVIAIPIALLLLGFNTEIEIFNIAKSKRNVKLFSLKLFSINMKIINPDYISVFGQSFSHDNDFSTVSALGSSTAFDLYVIRFFDENNRNQIVFKSKNRDEVLIKGSELSILLDVELVNKLE